HIQTTAHAGILAQIVPGQPEEGGGGLEPRTSGRVLLQMHKRPGKLDQPFVKIRLGPLSILEPQIFEDVVRLVEQALVKALEVPEIPGIQILPVAARDQPLDLRALLVLAHRSRVQAVPRLVKPKRRRSECASRAESS